MNIFKYLKEHLRLIFFFAVLMLFVNGVIIFDRSNRTLQSDTVYLNIVSFTLLFIYLLADYLIERRNIKRLLLESKSEFSTPILPKPHGRKDEIYQSIVNRMFRDYVNETGKLKDEFMENLDFMTAWAHEIKTPITTSKLLLQGDMSHADIESANEEIDKIEDYVDRVLYNARSGEFANDYLISSENLGSLVKESVKKHAVLFIRKHIELKDTVPDKLSVDTDRKWLLFILDQLFSNALKYTPESGSISVSAKQSEKETVLCIEDNGCGIKSEDMGRLFKKSFTGQNGRAESSKATGFGLYLSQKLAKKLGAFITIESEYGKGTRAFVHFPVLSDYYNLTKT